MKHYDVIIIGGGAIGSFTLFRLVKNNIRNCLLIEKARGPGRGATGAWGSLIRAMHRNPLTTKKASLSIPFFMRFAEIVGEGCLFNPCGSLYFFKNHDLSSIDEHRSHLREHDITHEIIEATRGKKEFSHFNWFDDDVAVFEPHAGTACPHQTTEALLRAACRDGAETIFGEEVTAIAAQNNSISTVRTQSGFVFTCDHLIIAAGSWTNTLLAQLGVHVDAFDKTIQINRFCKNHFDAKIPLFLDKTARTFGHFFHDGSFAGGHMTESENNASNKLQRLSLRDAHDAKLHLSKRLNWLKNASLEGGIRAVETYTEDGQGVVDNLGFNNLVVSTGFSCSGFTLAPCISEQIVGMIFNQT